MSNFKVGDKVAYYGSHPSSARPIEYEGLVTTVFTPEEQYPPQPDGGPVIYQVTSEGPEYWSMYAHPKQLRRVK